MSFVKAAFWIVIVLLLMPGNAQERFELYETVQRTIADIGNFCVRNPDVCEKTASAASGVVHRLKSTTDTIEEMLRDTGIGAERARRYDRDGYDRERHGALREPSEVSTTSSVPIDTLTASDLRPKWRGPGSI